MVAGGWGGRGHGPSCGRGGGGLHVKRAGGCPLVLTYKIEKFVDWKLNIAVGICHWVQNNNHTRPYIIGHYHTVKIARVEANSAVLDRIKRWKLGYDAGHLCSRIKCIVINTLTDQITFRNHTHLYFGVHWFTSLKGNSNHRIWTLLSAKVFMFCSEMFGLWQIYHLYYEYWSYFTVTTKRWKKSSDTIFWKYVNN